MIYHFLYNFTWVKYSGVLAQNGWKKSYSAAPIYSWKDKSLLSSAEASDNEFKVKIRDDRCY
jgi:hypothetical protein